MSTPPDITIIIPLHNDEVWVGDALRSALNQTWAAIEVICVDDASTDGTCAVVEQAQLADPRVRLYRRATNRTAYQARKLGVEQARGSYVLFLDGDDRLASDAAEVAYGLARKHEADLVGFGVEVLSHDGAHPTRFAADLQPAHSELVGNDIVKRLFPIGKVAQGHLWRYLWSTELLRSAYAALDDELELPRANDIPISFMGAVLARRYISTTAKLYQYYWRRGVSGLATENPAVFDFYLSAMNSIDALGVAIGLPASDRFPGKDLNAIFDSARLSMVQVLLRRCDEMLDGDLRDLCLRKLLARVGRVDAVRAAALFFPSALPMLAAGETVALAPRAEQPRVVMLTTGNLDIGGVQGVLVAQAKILRNAGFEVIVAVQSLGDTAALLPEDIPVVQWTGRNRAEKIADYLRYCADYAVDLIIDHHVLYNENWPFYVLAARAQGIPTIGWLHNFALRSLYDSTTRGSFLAENLPLLANVAVLSKADVAFWKLRGVERVTYLPNPPSPWLETNGVAKTPRRLRGGAIRLVWWGRLQQHTKRVLDFTDVAAELNRRGIDFHLTIIGPDSADATGEQLRASVRERGLEERVTVNGPLRGQDLIDALNDADVYVSLSGIEGYPLTLVEAQALGLPVVMYDLPWLAVLDGNEGVLRVPQKDTKALGAAIGQVAGDPTAYKRLSAASLDAAATAIEHDFEQLYVDFVAGNLTGADYSPAPTEANIRMLLDLAFKFSEEGIRRAARVERRAQARAENLNRQLKLLGQPGGGAAFDAHSSSINFLGTRIRGFGQRLRSSPARLIRRFANAERIVGARIDGGRVLLRFRVPHGKKVQSAQLYRHVDGSEIVHDLSLVEAPDGTIVAAQSVEELSRRRWRVRATLVVHGTAVRVVELPVHPGAPVRGDGHLKVRFHQDGTLQVYINE